MSRSSHGPLLGLIYPPTVFTCETQEPGVPSTLHPIEMEHVARAVPSRQREFAAGRLCAKDALMHMGVRSPIIGVGPTRAPLWPPETIGSISHTGGYACAAVARTSHHQSLGVDVEKIGAVSTDLWETIFTAQELEIINATPVSLRPILVTVMFSAKETYFKYQFPLTGRWIEFKEVSITVIGAGYTVKGGRWRASLETGRASEGRYACSNFYVVTGIC